MKIEESFFPDLSHEIGEKSKVKKLIVLSVDCTKAFAAKKEEIPSEADNLRDDGYPPLHIGEENRALIGDKLRVWHQRFKDLEIPIIATKDSHDWEDINQLAEKAVYGIHAEEGGYEAELIDDICEYPDYVIPKTTYDSFYGTDLKETMKSLHPGLHELEVGVIVCGFVTHVCIASALIRLAPMGYRPILASFLVGDFDRQQHDTCVRSLFPSWGTIVIEDEESLCRLLGQ